MLAGVIAAAALRAPATGDTTLAEAAAGLLDVLGRSGGDGPLTSGDRALLT